MQEAVPRTVETYVTRDGKDVFQGWLDGLGDAGQEYWWIRRLPKSGLGNLGHHKSVGEGVQEIVLDYGPGYRIYFGEHGAIRVILLLGSTKRRQAEAITLAKRYWTDWKERTLR